MSDPFWTFGLDLSNTALAFVDDRLNGLGLTGIWGAENDLEPIGNTAREQAEVWFDKV